MRIMPLLKEIAQNIGRQVENIVVPEKLIESI